MPCTQSMGVRLSVPAGCWDVQNGLVLYTGTVMTDDGKEKKVNIDFEPFKPINTSLYLCDNKFHTEVNSRPSPCTSCPASLLLLPGCAVTTRYIAYNTSEFHGDMRNTVWKMPAWLWY
jgi:hypothetical protein